MKRRSTPKRTANLGRSCAGHVRSLCSIALAVLLLSQAGASAPAQDRSASSYNSSLEKAIEFYSQKKYSEAAAFLDTLSHANPDRKEAFLWLGHARAELKDWSAAREAYKRYSELAPQDVEGPRGVARTYEMEGKKELATFWYKKALDLEPANENIKAALNRLATEPAAVTPSASQSPKAAEEKSANKNSEPGFWHQGIAGMVGARRVWWVRLIAIAIFGLMMSQGAFSSGKNIRDRFPTASATVIVVNAMVGASILYLLTWGVPAESYGWALMGICILVSAGLSTGGAASR